MPVTENLPHEWYNTPNLHMCTIKDFYNFCSSKNIKIFKSIALKKSRISEINKSNLNSNFFVKSKNKVVKDKK